MLSDCPKCWDTPCTCGYLYESWSIKNLKEFVTILEKVLEVKELREINENRTKSS